MEIFSILCITHVRQLPVDETVIMKIRQINSSLEELRDASEMKNKIHNMALHTKRMTLASGFFSMYSTMFPFLKKGRTRLGCPRH